MDVSGLETSLFEIHALIAAVTHPAVALEQDEARALAQALANVQRHYPGVRLLSDKHMALAALAMTAGRIYGKRAVIVLGGAPPAAAGMPAPAMRDVTPPAAPPPHVNGADPATDVARAAVAAHTPWGNPDPGDPSQ